jgi:hypothetical protein
MSFIQDWRHKRLRKQHRKYAQEMGQFWKECPACGVEFGGHEWQMMDVPVRNLVIHYGDDELAKAYVGVCPACCEAGVGITMEEAMEEMFQEPLPTEEEMGLDVTFSSDELLG